MKKQVIRKEVYVADDGREFDEELDAIAYEEILTQIAIQKPYALSQDIWYDVIFENGAIWKLLKYNKTILVEEYVLNTLLEAIITAIAPISSVGADKKLEQLKGILPMYMSNKAGVSPEGLLGGLIMDIQNILETV